MIIPAWNCGLIAAEIDCKDRQAIGKRGQAIGKQSLKYCQTMVKLLSNTSQTIVLNIAKQLLSDD